MKLALAIFTIFLVFFKVNGQELGRLVDNFKIGKNDAEVVFFDPFQKILKTNPSFNNLTNQGKSDFLDNYLHNSVLYEFKVTDRKTKQVSLYKIVGNPELTKSKMFYQVKVFEANHDSASRVIEKVNCGGTLFEHMSLFDDPDKKKHIGNGIQLFGYFRRVQPYSEIKASMTHLIEQDLVK